MKRFTAGCSPVTLLHRECLTENAPVTYRMVRAYIATLRTASPQARPPPSVRQVTGTLTWHSTALSEEDRAALKGRPGSAPTWTPLPNMSVPVCRAVRFTGLRAVTRPVAWRSTSKQKRNPLLALCRAGCSACFVAVPSAVRDYTDGDTTFIGMVRGITETERRMTCPVAKARTRQLPLRPLRRLGPGRTGTGGRISWTFKFSTSTRPAPIRWTRTSATRESSRPSTSTH